MRQNHGLTVRPLSRGFGVHGLLLERRELIGIDAKQPPGRKGRGGKKASSFSLLEPFLVVDGSDQDLPAV